MKQTLLVCLFLVASITITSAQFLNDPYLIWDPEGSPSAEAMNQVLVDLGYEGEITSDIYEYILTLDEYEPLIVFADYQTSPDVLEDIESDILYYLQDGGSIYWQNEAILMYEFYSENIFRAGILTCIAEPATYLSGEDGILESISYLSCDTIYAQPIMGYDDGMVEALRAPESPNCPQKALASEQPYRTMLASFEFSALNDDGLQTRADYVQSVIDWLTLTVDVPEVEFHLLPEEYVHMTCYPNPFNLSTVISFEVLRSAEIEINVFNILGQPVESLAKDWYEPGEYSVEWSGQKHPTGIYFARLESSVQNSTIRMVLLK